MFNKIIGTAAFLCALTGAAQSGGTSPAPSACSGFTLGTNGALNGYVPSPSDAWHQDISAAALAANSAKIISTAADLGGVNLHPDFSSIAAGGFGIPYTVVDSQSTTPIIVPIGDFVDESDVAAIPVPSTLPVEVPTVECPTDGNDRHAIIIDRNKCVAYELYQAAHCTSGWTASGETLWDFTTTEKRPYGFTSADAAGLSIFEGLIRYDEIVAGSINHAIRFTARNTQTDAHHGLFAAPATHAAGNSSTTDNIMGMRIRLKASYDISKFSSTNQIILKAMKQYGMILADNGSNMFFQGTPDARWNDSDLNALKTVPSSAFDVIQMGTLYDSATAPKGAIPSITSFTASATSVASGTAVTLTPTITGGSYNYIDSIGVVRGPVTVTPTATTTYTLTSRNQFGTTSAAVTVTVTKTTSGTPKLTFTPIYTATFGAAPFTVSATSASTGAVTYSITSGPATVAGNTVTTTGVGTVVVKATQAAAGTYAAGTASMSIPVKAGSPSLVFVPIADLNYGLPAFAVSSTTQSAGSINYTVYSGPATVSGNMVTPTGLGKVTLEAVQAASGNYVSASAFVSFRVNAEPVTITFGTIPAETLGNAPFTVTATSNSTAPISYAVMSGPASVSGSTVTMNGAGSITLRARQSTSGVYDAGVALTTFTVAPRTVAAK